MGPALIAIGSLLVLVVIAANRSIRSQVSQLVDRDRSLILIVGTALAAVIIGLSRLGGPSSDIVIMTDLIIFALAIGWLLWPG